MPLELDKLVEGAERETLAAIVADHERHPHAGMTPARLRLHALLHLVAERQIRDREPAAVAEALARLLAAGAPRHDAIHAICDVVAEEVVGVVSRGERYNAERYVTRLRALTYP